MQQQDFCRYFDDYLTALRLAGKSAHTVEAYRRDLSLLVRLLMLRPSENGADVGRGDFLAALKKLSQRNLSERSMARKLSVWRQYCGWLVQRGLMAADPTANLKAPKPPQRLPKAVQQEPLNHLLNQGCGEDALALRDRAVFELLYGSGLRLSEVCGLNLHDVLPDEGWVGVTGKGGKQRRVPLVRKSIDALLDYLPHRIAAEGEAALFTNKNGRRLGQRQIQKRLQQWAAGQCAAPFAAHAAAQLRQPPFAGVARHPCGTGIAGAQQFVDHADLHQAGLGTSGRRI